MKTTAKEYPIINHYNLALYRSSAIMPMANYVTNTLTLNGAEDKISKINNHIDMLLMKEGSMWNECDVIRETPKRIVIITPWFTPFKVMNNLSKDFPDVTFNVSFVTDDPNDGVNKYTLLGGHYVSNNGSEVNMDEKKERVFSSLEVFMNNVLNNPPYEY